MRAPAREVRVVGRVGRETGADEVGMRYAAHRLELVRLAVLLVDDTAAADDLVQQVFLAYLRRGEARRDPGAGLADLRTLVVREARVQWRRSGRARPSTDLTPHEPPRGPGGHAGLADLSQPQREAGALTLWAGLSPQQAAIVLGTTERAVLSSAGRAVEAVGGTPERLAEVMHRRADSVSGASLRGSWAAVLAEDARRSARTRRGWRTAGGVTAGVLALAVAATVVARRPTDITPAPVPTPSITATEALSSPALAPGEHPRADIPWSKVTAGWSVIAASAPPTAVTTTLLLVDPGGTRYALGTAPESIVIQDVSTDGKRVLLAVGSQASEWDLEAGTSRPLGVSYGWKTMRYAGDAGRGYLVLWTDSNSAVRLDRWTPDGRLAAEYPLTLPPTAGSPGTPGLVVDTSGRQAAVATLDGTVRTIDLVTDGVATLPLPAGSTGCSPRSTWSAGQVVVACSSGGGRLLLSPLDGSPARSIGEGGLVSAWLVSPQAALVQRDDPCSTSVGTLNAGGALSPWAAPAVATGLVPNTVVGGTLFLGGTRCPTDGSQLVAYDLASGRATELAGEDAGARTVRQAVVLRPRT